MVTLKKARGLGRRSEEILVLDPRGPCAALVAELEHVGLPTRAVEHVATARALTLSSRRKTILVDLDEGTRELLALVDELRASAVLVIGMCTPHGAAAVRYWQRRLLWLPKPVRAVDVLETFEALGTLSPRSLDLAEREEIEQQVAIRGTVTGAATALGRTRSVIQRIRSRPWPAR